MISLVVCHRNSYYLNQFKKNVYDTIGIPFEFIIIDNSSNQYSIFQAYNIGVERSKYNLICFAHEDIIFHTNNWGRNIIDHFKDEVVGMIGVAGGTAFPNCPGTWWNDVSPNEQFLNIIQHRNVTDKSLILGQSKESEKTDSVYHDFKNPNNEKRVKVVALDGVFLCARKEVFSSCRFDDKVFNGFHCYDLDICFQIIQKNSVFVIFDVLIEHFSPGSLNKSWVESLELLTKKWKNKLPVFTKNVPLQTIPFYNLQNLIIYCNLLIRLGYSDKKITRAIRLNHSFIPIQWGIREYFTISKYFIFGKKQIDLLSKLSSKVRGSLKRIISRLNYYF